MLDAKSLLETFGVLGLFGIIFAETGLLLGFFLPGDSLLVLAGLVAAVGKDSNLNLPGGIGGLGYTNPTKTGGTINPPGSLNEALDVIRFVASKGKGKQVIVIDEMERIESADEKEKFAEFIKNIPDCPIPSGSFSAE